MYQFIAYVVFQYFIVVFIPNSPFLTNLCKIGHAKSEVICQDPKIRMSIQNMFLSTHCILHTACCSKSNKGCRQHRRHHMLLHGQHFVRDFFSTSLTSHGFLFESRIPSLQFGGTMMAAWLHFTNMTPVSSSMKGNKPNNNVRSSYSSHSSVRNEPDERHKRS